MGAWATVIVNHVTCEVYRAYLGGVHELLQCPSMKTCSSTASDTIWKVYISLQSVVVSFTARGILQLNSRASRKVLWLLEEGGEEATALVETSRESLVSRTAR